MDFRFGNGFDVHKFGDGKFLLLCGVKIPFSKSLIGHSDADVGLHSVTDAIFGAIGMGDIGIHFPPTVSKWKNKDSTFFLKYAEKLMKSECYSINNIDITFICELPRINHYSDKMKTNLSSILDLNRSQVSIKATTTEGLGFTGREEGIACLTTIGIKSP
jgi:2-C-methyl-D-erythritol 4-phosphate cytidylyltransferase/2-C-methyl-D-erythritol 2,4-cyclodiphosphate synthase